MFNTYFRTNTCGELRLADAGKKVVLSGWVQRSRKLGGMTFIDLRDRYGITQLVVSADAPAELVEVANSLGREFVIQAEGEVIERQSKNAKMDTGEIEIKLSSINILNKSVTPPFTMKTKATAVMTSEPNTDTSTSEETRSRMRLCSVTRSLTKYATSSTARASWRLRPLTSSNPHLKEHVTSWYLPE